MTFQDIEAHSKIVLPADFYKFCQDFEIHISKNVMTFLSKGLGILLTILTVGGVKIGYAIIATKVVTMARGLKLEKEVITIAGGLMIGAGSYLIIKA